MSGVSSIPSGSSYYVNYSPYAPTIPDDAVGTRGMSGQASYPEEELASADSNVSINFDQPALEDRAQLPSVGQAALGGAFAFTGAACDCGGVNLTGDGEDDADVADTDGDSEPDEIPSEVEGDFSYEDYVDEYYDEATDEAGEEDHVEVTDEYVAEDYYEDYTEEEAAPSVCDNWPETVALTLPADGAIRVPYYTDSAIDISFPFPNDPDEATAGDVVTCEVEIDDNRSFSSPITRPVAEPGNLSFTPASPSEYFACATDYWARVRCFDSCTTESHEVVSAPVRFTTGPTVEWTRTYNGAGNGTDQGNGITLDSSGNAYVIGTTQTASDWWAKDIWIRAYDIDGNPIWTQTFDGPDRSSDEGHDVAVDRSGNIYAIGQVADIPLPMSGDSDVWLGSFGSDGSRRWITTYDSPGSITFDFDAGRSVAVGDSSGGLYVYGVGYTSLTDAEGDIFWLGQFQAASGFLFGVSTDNNLDGWLTDVAADNSGNVYVVSGIDVPGEGRNILTRRYDRWLTASWTRTYNGRYNGNDSGGDIAADDTGNVYVTGSEQTSSSTYQPWLGRYDADGNLIWDQIAGGDGVAANILGSVYSTGRARSTSAPVTTRINPATGEIICTAPESADIEPRALSVDDFGNVYLTGNQTVPGEGSNIWVRRYSGF